MAVPATIIKVKGAKALSALCANGQVPLCLKVNGAALAGSGTGALKALEVEGTRAVLTKGAVWPAAEVEFGGAKAVAAKSWVVGAGSGKAAAAAKGGMLAGYGCFGLGPWGFGFLLTTLGLAAVSYYLYRRNQQLSDEFAGETPL